LDLPRGDDLDGVRESKGSEAVITRKWIVEAIAATVCWATIVALAPAPEGNLGGVLAVCGLALILAAITKVAGTLLLERRVPSLRVVRQAREPLDWRGWAVGGAAGLATLVVLLAVLGPDRVFQAQVSAFFVAVLTESLVRNSLVGSRREVAG
jgi:hypothetical protein